MKHNQVAAVVREALLKFLSQDFRSSSSISIGASFGFSEASQGFPRDLAKLFPVYSYQE
jgi:hypothetical protein